MRDILKKLKKDKNMLSMSVAIAIVATASLVTTVCLGCNSSNKEKAINLKTAAEAQKLDNIMQEDIAEISKEIQKEATKENNLSFAADTSGNCSQVESNNVDDNSNFVESNNAVRSDNNCFAEELTDKLLSNVNKNCNTITVGKGNCNTIAGTTGNCNTITANNGNCDTKVIDNCTNQSNGNIQGDNITSVLSNTDDDADNSDNAITGSKSDIHNDEKPLGNVAVDNNTKLQNNNVSKNSVNNNAANNNATKSGDNKADKKSSDQQSQITSGDSVTAKVSDNQNKNQMNNQVNANSNDCFTNGADNCNTDCDTDCNISDDKVSVCENNSCPSSDVQNIISGNNSCPSSNIQNIISGNSNCPSSNVQGIIIGNGNCPISNIQDIISGNGNCSALNIQDILSGNSNYSISNGQIIISGNNCNQSSQNGGQTNTNNNASTDKSVGNNVPGTSTNTNVNGNGNSNTNPNAGTNTNTSASNVQYSDYVDEVIRLVNIERNNAGLSSLTKNTKLCTVANVRANEIVTLFSHTRPNGKDCFSVLSEYNITYRTCGENIAWGQTSPAQVVEGWMNSPGHRANILNSNFSEIGVGVTYSGGRYYWSQMFLG